MPSNTGKRPENAARDSGIGHFALSAAYEAAGRAADAQEEVRQAGSLDPINLGTRPIPDAHQVWVYLVTGGRVPVLSPPNN